MARWRKANPAQRKEYRERMYRERRTAALIHLGAVCAECGGVDRLQFDHVNRDHKNANMDALFRDASQDRIDAEVALCQLLCISCHGRKSRYEYLSSKGES